MSFGTTELNSGTGGSKVLHDSLATVDGSSAPSGAVAQLVKFGFGIEGAYRSVSDTYRLPVQDAAYDPVFGKTLVGTARDKFRDEFATFDETNNWERIQTGSGHTITVAGAANGSRYLNIATGTTPSSETIILSRQTFKFPIKMAFALSMSQRIANQEVFVELVSVDAAGAVETDTSIATSTNLNNATNALSLKWDGTTAANALSIVRGYGISEIAQASSAYLTTLATGTSPNFIPAAVFEINGDMEEAVFGARSIDSLAALSGVNKRTQYLPDPSKDYKIRIRVRNTGTPASTTDVRIHNVRVLDTTRFTIDWARHMGRTTDIADSLPAYITGAATLTVNATLQASTNAAGDVGIQYRASATGGATPASILSPATPVAASIKAAAGRLVGLVLTNTSASVRSMKFWNTAVAGVTLGTTAALFEIDIPAGQSISIAFDGGISFSTAITWAVTGAKGLTDNTAITANDVSGVALYA